MKQIKFFLMAFAALCLVTTAQAQTTKSQTKVTNEKAAKSKQKAKYQCTMKCEGDKTYARAGKCPICNMSLTAVEASKVAYQCPMNCEGDKTYAKEGKCPVCNMKLKALPAKAKKKENDHSGHSH